MNMHCEIEIREIGSIRPYEQNPRLNDKAVDAVAASLREFGFRQPIVVDSAGVIIAGHTRYKAALKLGLAKVPVHVATDLTPDQVRAYRIGDNKTGEIAEWDFAILPIELAALQSAGFDLGSLAFSERELAKLLDTSVKQGLTDPDAVPEPPDDPVTQKGDLWILGDHRLLCGDSANPADIDYLLDGNVIDLVNTDPPYNVRLEPRSNNAIAAGLSSFPATEKSLDKSGMHHSGMDLARHPEKSTPTHKKMRPKDRPLANDFVSDEEFERLLNGWFGNISRTLRPGGGFYIWGGYSNISNYPGVLKKHGLYFSQCIIWKKCHPVMTRKDFMGDHEWAFYGWKEGAAHRFFGPHNITDVWEVKKVPPQQMEHLTQKVCLMYCA